MNALVGAVPDYMLEIGYVFSLLIRLNLRDPCSFIYLCPSVSVSIYDSEITQGVFP